MLMEATGTIKDMTIWSQLILTKLQKLHRKQLHLIDQWKINLVKLTSSGGLEVFLFKFDIC